MVRVPLLLFTAAALVACRGEAPAEAPGQDPARPAPPADFELAAASGERLVVATVAGRPVHGDCVARQAAAHGLDRRAALDECIGFELLAAEAERQGYLADPEVQETGKREAVRALIERDFELEGPGDLPDEDVRRAWERHEGVINRPELRVSYYCRAALEHEEPDDSPEERQARDRVEALGRELAGRHVSLEEFRSACAERVGDDGVLTRNGLQHSPLQMIRMVRDDGSEERLRRPGDAVDRTYSEAVFAIPEEGLVSEPTRVRWGWDLLYVGDIAPAVDLSYEEAEPELRERLYQDDGMRQMLFRRWAEPLSQGRRVELHLERIPEESAPLAGQDGT